MPACCLLLPAACCLLLVLAAACCLLPAACCWCPWLTRSFEPCLAALGFYTAELSIAQADPLCPSHDAIYGNRPPPHHTLLDGSASVAAQLALALGVSKPSPPPQATLPGALPEHEGGLQLPVGTGRAPCQTAGTLQEARAAVFVVGVSAVVWGGVLLHYACRECARRSKERGAHVLEDSDGSVVAVRSCPPNARRPWLPPATARLMVVAFGLSRLCSASWRWALRPMTPRTCCTSGQPLCPWPTPPSGDTRTAGSASTCRRCRARCCAGCRRSAGTTREKRQVPAGRTPPIANSYSWVAWAVVAQKAPRGAAPLWRVVLGIA
jgi:hypothetical protein